MKPHLNKKVIFSALSIFLTLASCTRNPATGEKDFTAFMSKNQEIEIGAKEHPKILQLFGGEYQYRSLNEYIRFIGNKLASVSDLPDLKYRFTILNDEKVNAFALPGGYVYVTRGLLALANNEAELAGVIAHEIAHITARHSAQRYSATMATNIGLNIFGALGSAAGLPVGVNQIVSFGANAAIKGYSRKQELEADKLGVRYMVMAGYSPNAMHSFFNSLAAHSRLEAKQNRGTKVTHNIMSTHPRTTVRILQAIKLAKTESAINFNFYRNQYLRQIDGMIFGDDPKQGLRKGQEFLHPELRFRFEVPPGFFMFNNRNNVVATGPNGSKIEFSMVTLKTSRSATDLGRYLTKIWGKNLHLKNIEKINISNLDAVTGTSKISNGKADIRLVVIQGSPTELFRFAFVTPRKETKILSKHLQRTTFSFRRLNPAETKTIQPLRLKIISFKKENAKNISSLKMEFTNNQFTEDWFYLLNRIENFEQLDHGQLIKLVHRG